MRHEYVHHKDGTIKPSVANPSLPAARAKTRRRGPTRSRQGQRFAVPLTRSSISHNALLDLSAPRQDITTRETDQSDTGAVDGPCTPSIPQDHTSESVANDDFGLALIFGDTRGHLLDPSLEHRHLHVSGPTLATNLVASTGPLVALNEVPGQAAMTTDGDVNDCSFPTDQSMDFDYDIGGMIWEDFQLGDLNSWFLGRSPPQHFEMPRQPSLAIQAISDNEQCAEANEKQPNKNDVAAIVEQLWFTRLESDCQSVLGTLAHAAFGHSTPRGSKFGRDDINEIYRISLTNRLRPQYSHEALPSTDFLVSLQFIFIVEGNCKMG